MLLLQFHCFIRLYDYLLCELHYSKNQEMIKLTFLGMRENLLLDGYGVVQSLCIQVISFSCLAMQQVKSE